MERSIILEIQDTQLVYRWLEQKPPLPRNQRLSLPVGVVEDGKINDEKRLLQMLKAFLPKEAKACYVLVHTSSVVTFTRYFYGKRIKDVAARLTYYGEQWLTYGTTYAIGYWIAKEKHKRYKIQGIGIPKEWFEAYVCLCEALNLSLKSFVPKRAYILRCIEQQQIHGPSYTVFIENNKLYSMMTREDQQLISLVLCGQEETKDIPKSEYFLAQLERGLGWYEENYPKDPLVHWVISLPKDKDRLSKSLHEVGRYVGLTCHHIKDDHVYLTNTLKNHPLLPLAYKQHKYYQQCSRRCLKAVAVLSVVGCIGWGGISFQQQQVKNKLHLHQSTKSAHQNAALQLNEAPIDPRLQQLNSNKINTMYDTYYPKFKAYEQYVKGYQFHREKSKLEVWLVTETLDEASKILQEVEGQLEGVEVTSHLEDWSEAKGVQLKLEVEIKDVKNHETPPH